MGGQQSNANKNDGMSMTTMTDTRTTRTHGTVDEIANAVARVLGDAARPIALHEPRFSGNESRYAEECLRTGWVSSAGAYVDRLERELAAFTGAKSAVVTVNGTAALHAALVLCGVGRDDEVLIPALTFVATANAVSYCGAVPHLVEIDERTLGVDAAKLAAYLDATTTRAAGGLVNKVTGRRICALVPMHCFGCPADLDGLLAVCERFGLDLIEDAAESIGSTYAGRHTGTFGRIGILSFNGNKTITTGGGGAILTNDVALGKAAKHLTSTARVPHQWELKHDRVAFNYRMPNINAAIGVAQMERLPDILRAKRSLAERYAKEFAGVSGARFFTEPAGCTSNYWLNTVILEDTGQRDALLARLHEEQILARPAWTLVGDLPMYTGVPTMDLTVTRRLAAGMVNLPSSPHL